MVQLSKAQQAIKDHDVGPAIVVAGAGSGKTQVICSRTLALIQKGARPDRILQLTFSRKAATEMRERLLRLGGDDVRAARVRMETFHAFCARTIREAPELFGRTKNPTIVDDSDQKQVYKRAAERLQWDLKDPDRKDLFPRIIKFFSYAKNWGYTPATHPEVVAELLLERFGTPENVRSATSLIQEYERQLKQLNALDFDDLCLKMMQALENPGHQSFRERMQSRYDFVSVDESQDTNNVQYRIVRVLALKHKNLVMVGDDKQSIYAFRGARPDNLRQFIEDFSAKIFPLQQNYRSTKAIVEAAGALISHNDQLPGTSYSVRDDGPPPQLVVADTASSLALEVSTRIRGWVAAGDLPTDIAILYRTNRISRLMEVAMRSAGVEYQVVGGTSLFETLEGRAVIAAVKLISNPQDSTAIAPLAEFLPGLSEGGIAKLAERMDRHSEPLWAAASEMGGRIAAVVERLLRGIDYLRELGPHRVGDWMVSTQGLDLPQFYADRIARSKRPEELEAEMARRLDNLRIIDEALGAALERAAAQAAAPGAADPQDWRAHLSEDAQWQVVLESRIDDRDEDARDRRPRVTLSTIHRSKGLEWKRVIVAGFSQGLLPLGRQFAVEDAQNDAIDSGAKPQESKGVPAEGINLPEERRLAYVAITRAKQECILAHAHDIHPYAETTMAVSSFYKEMLAPRIRGASSAQR